MPIIEYKCKACEHQFENIQKFSEPDLQKCPKCKKKLKKLLGIPARAIIKGGTPRFHK